MSSRQPWKEVKALANQAAPPLQLVLPSELEAAVASKVAACDVVDRTRKDCKAPTKPKEPSRKDLPENIILQPEQVAVPAGVFIADSGPLQHDVCPTSAGAVVITAVQATCYMRISPPRC